MSGRAIGAPARAGTMLLVVAVMAVASLFSPYASAAAYADCPANPADCLGNQSVVDCLDPPTPAMPDTGSTGFFGSEPPAVPKDGKRYAGSRYDDYGYAGLQYHTYDLGCGPDGAVAPDALVNTSIANMMLGVATFVVGLTNSVREYAYDPDSMWGWTDSLVAKASDALYERIFTVLGLVAVVVVGVWLMWSARRGDLSDAATTAGWAILVMVITTAIAAWPLKAAAVADTTLTGALGVVSGALHPSSSKPCGPTTCVEGRTPQRQASGVLTDVVLYRQWLSGELGSADSPTADKYGERLYAASVLSWEETKSVRSDPTRRDEIIKRKQQEWKDVAAEIKKSDPDAYEYLTGKQGSSRIGSAFTALVAAFVAVPFDLMASILIIIAFLIIRLAVAFLPAIAVFGILRPASGPLRGLFRTVVAAILNCVVFGVGASVYLLAVELITGTASLAGWQQILLIWLTGLVLWLLLRPFRRLTSLTGKNPFGELAGGLGKVQRKLFGDLKQLGIQSAGAYAGTSAALAANDERADSRRDARPESWSRQDTGVLSGRDAPPAREGSAAGTRTAGTDADDPPPRSAEPRDESPRRRGGTSAPEARPETLTTPFYRDPGFMTDRTSDPLPSESGDSYVVYRPDRGYQTVSGDAGSRHAAVRTSQAAANVAAAANAVRDMADATRSGGRSDDRGA